MPVLTPLNPDTLPMGVNVVPDRTGATIRVRAPRAHRVWVRGTFNDWVTDDSSLLQRHGDFWVGFIPGVKPGDQYKFFVEGGLADPEWKRDPWARDLTKDPAYPWSNCIVIEPADYPWRDGGYQPPFFHDLVIYQLHVGTFNGPNRQNRVAKFLDVLGKLDYLAALGVNALLFLPIIEFTSPRGLGYDGADIFSPEQDYALGPDEVADYLPLVNDLRRRAGLSDVDAAFLNVMPNQLKVVVELCHHRGLAVLFDVVYNHVSKDIPGKDGVQSMWNFEQFDMQHNHDSYHWSDQDHTGPAWDLDWKEPTRQFLIDNAKFFIDEYHIDGLRYDETTAILRNSSDRGWAWFQALTSTVRAKKDRAVQIAEHWPSLGPDPWVVSTQPGHAGFDICYHDGFRNAVRDALSAASAGQEATVDVARIGQYLWPANFPEAWRCLQHLENHDIAREHDRVPQLAAPGQGHSWWGASRSRVATGLLLTAPGTPMLFMGEEFLEDKRWSDNPQGSESSLLWWHGLDAGADRAMVNFHRFMEEVIQLRFAHAALRLGLLKVLHQWNPTRVLAFHRWFEGSGQDVVVVASFNDHTLWDYELPWPGDGSWREIFNTDAYDDYQPTGNGGGITASAQPRDGWPATARLVLPANSLLVFSR